jgi:hypothetical protein
MQRQIQRLKASTTIGEALFITIILFSLNSLSDNRSMAVNGSHRARSLDAHCSLLAARCSLLAARCSLLRRTCRTWSPSATNIMVDIIFRPSVGHALGPKRPNDGLAKTDLRQQSQDRTVPILITSQAAKRRTSSFKSVTRDNCTVGPD